MSIEDQNIPPVPSQSPLNEADADQRKIGVTWSQWFEQIRTKINILNGSLVALASISGVGIAVRTIGGWVTRTITGTTGNISVANGDGSAGNPTINLIDTAVTPGSYTSANITVDQKGRLTSAASGSGGGSPLTTKGDIYGFDTAPARIPVGSNDGDVLTVDSTNSLGVSYQSPGVGPNYSSVVLADTPIGFWKLDDASGTTAIDSSGNGINGTYIGGFTLLGTSGPGNLPGGVLLNGTTGHISIPSNSLFNISGNWTVEGWCSVNSTLGRQFLLCQAAATTSSPENFAIGINCSNINATKIETGFYTGVAWAVSVGPVISPATLLHIVGTYTGTVANVYVNGALFSSTNISGFSSSVAGITLGCNGSSTVFLGGVISSCAVYAGILSATRIKAHYLAGR